jgi:crotonobetainyl-CoA:carnitine CoA-transferase CaiB-like acyl-CoA transferase
MIIEAPVDGGPPRRMVGPLARLSETPARIRHILPETGAETEAILGEVGVPPERVAALRQQGVLL